MMQKLGKLPRETKPIFATLTFPDEFYKSRFDQDLLEKIMQRLYARFRRKYPAAGAFWRKEFERRKSGRHIGEVFPHYHLLVYGVKQVAFFQGWLQLAWWEVCGKLSLQHLKAGTSASEVRSYKGVTHYASKYLAKMPEFEFGTGRIWGIWQEHNLPWIAPVLVQIGEQKAVAVIRLLRRYARVKGRDLRALRLLVNNPEFWLEKVLPQIK